MIQLLHQRVVHICFWACIIITITEEKRKRPSPFSALDECNWTSSGVRHQGEVRTAYVRCTQGDILWTEPSGVLRIALRPPATRVRHRRRPLCILVRTTMPSILSSSRLYIRDYHGSLRPVLVPAQGVYHCLGTMAHGTVVLFAEAPLRHHHHRTIGKKRPLFHLRYNFEPGHHHRWSNDVDRYKDADYWPCNMHEVLQVLCTGDFAVRGTMMKSRHQPTEVRLLVSEVIKVREAGPMTSLFALNSSTTVTFGFPSPVDWSATNDGRQYFFMGVIGWMGKAVVTCAPPWTTWQYWQLKRSHSHPSSCP